MHWVSRCLMLFLVVFGFSTLSSSPSLAISCESTTTDPLNYLSVTYYLSSSSCSKTNPGSTLLLSAAIDDFNATVTFFPANVVVASSVTSPACTHAGPPNSGNVAGYAFQQSTTCSVLISLTNGASLSFNVEFAADGYANSVTNVNFVPGVSNPSWTLTSIPSPASFSAAGQAIGYNYTLTNTGDVTINSISVSGTKTGTISCLANTLAVGASTTCTSSYPTVPGDLGSNIAYNATAVGTPAGGTLANAVASGSITFTPQPSWTLSAIPNPTSFTNSGQAIGYSYTLTNTGNVGISSISVTGTKTGTISCLANTLAVGASTTCTSSYQTVSGDLGSNIAYNATAVGTPAGGTLANAVASGSITFTPQPSLTVAVTALPNTYSNAGQAIVYSFVVTNTGNVTIGSIAVTDTKVTAITCPASTLALGASTTCTGTYTTVASDVLTGSITDTATATGTFGANAVTSPAVATTLQLDTNAVRQATQSAIRNFMNHRADMITSASPDTSRMHQRLTGTLFGNSGDKEEPSQLGGPTASQLGGRAAALGGPDNNFGEDTTARRRPGRGDSMAADGLLSGRSNAGSLNPLSVSGSTVDGGGRFAFATSLSQMMEAAEATKAAQEASVDAPMGLGAGKRANPPSKSQTLRPAAFDVWAEGSLSYYENDGLDARQRGHASMLYVGFDYQLHPAILVGMLVQFDWMSETSSSLGTSASGRGWMVGPYLSARLTRNLFFDARAAWGQSDNSVDPLGIYTDKFSTDRNLVSGKLTGNWSFGNVQFRPSAEIIYFHETQKSYVNQLNIFIPEQSISLGRVTAGPEIAYRFRQPGGAILEPFIGIKAVWDFAKTADTTIAGTVIGNNPLRGKVEGGATYSTPSGVSVRASVSYDGLGDSDFQAYTGRAFVSVPLN